MSVRYKTSVGFTLIELSIVISIIGVLASVAGTQYIGYLERARMARAIVELRGISAQLEAFGDDDNVLPASLSDSGITTKDPWGNPYQYLLIEGQLPPGMASNSAGLPHVGAPGDAGGNDGGGGGGGGQPSIASARKDRFLVPINSDFDLYSVGPDGESMPTLNHPTSRDDIIRAADGAFYGLAEKF